MTHAALSLLLDCDTFEQPVAEFSVHIMSRYSSRSSLSHFYVWSRCGTTVASVQLGRTPTVPSLSDRLSHGPPTSSSVRSPLLLPCTSILIALFPMYSSSLLITCPYHRILRSWTSFEISHFRGSSDLIVSDPVQPSDTAHPS